MAGERHRRGDREGAEQACRRALRFDRGNVAARLMLADLMLARGRCDEAARLAGEAASLEPRNAIAHFTLGRAAHLAGDAGTARRSYERAAALRPDLAVAHCNLAIVLFDLKEFEGAWAAALRALERDLTLAEAHMTLGRAVYELEHYDLAVAALQRAIELDPRLAEAHNALGHASHQRRDYEQAVACHRRALELDDRLPHAWCGLGIALKTQGRFAEAAECFRRALALQPDYGEAQRNLALCAKDIAADAEIAPMRETLADASLPWAERAAAGFGLGKRLDDRGDFDEAFAAYAAANALCRSAAAAAGHVFDPVAFHDEVDRLIGTFTPEYFARYRSAGVASELPVFVVGSFRSGTTLTEQILASHPAVFGAGELRELRDLADTLGPDPGARGDAVLKARAESHLAVLAARGGGARRVVDKHPDNIFSLGLVALLFPAARVVLCRRDIRDVALSCYFQRFQQSMAFATDPAECGRRCLELARLAEHWRRVLPLPLLDLEYESLVANFEPEARRLVEFAGLDWEPSCLRYHETERPVHTPSNWGVRQPIYASSVGRWRHYERHLGPLLSLLAEAGSEDAYPGRVTVSSG